MKKLYSFLTGIVLVILVLWGIIHQIEASMNTKNSDKLVIYNWGDYIDPELLKEFTKETGIQVQYNTFDSNEAMYTKIKQGGTTYDIAIPSEYMIAKMMDDLRNNPPKKFGAWDVVEFRDYKKDECTVIATGEKKPTGLPESNVLYFELNDHAWCCARPSGTEPKIKFYMGVKGTGLEDADKKLEELTDAVSEIVGL